MDREGYVKIGGRKSIFVHRILIEYKYKRKLKINEIVDHINTVKHDNRLSNLRLTDNKGNSNNEISINKLVKNKVVLTDVFGNFLYYGSIPNICKIVGISHMGYEQALNQKYLGKGLSHYFCIKPGDSIGLYEKIRKMLYVLPEDGKLIGGYKSLSELIHQLNINHSYQKVKSYINNSKSISGYKIITGNSLISNYNFKIGNAYKFNYNMSEEDIELLKSDVEIKTNNLR